MDPKEQFDRQAKYYANSPTFSLGLSLELLSKLIKGKKFSKSLDIGTGSGFTAFEISKNCSYPFTENGIGTLGILGIGQLEILKTENKREYLFILMIKAS